MAAPKETWPELVGKTYEEAKAKIAQERPDVRVESLNEGAPATMDYLPERVRVIVNGSGVVTVAPMTG